LRSATGRVYSRAVEFLAGITKNDEREAAREEEIRPPRRRGRERAGVKPLKEFQSDEHNPIEAAERIIATMPNPPEIQHAGSKAFYSSDTDRVTMPPRNLFTSAEESVQGVGVS
jgi:hypothetical protein